MKPSFARIALVLGLLSIVGPIAIDMYLPGLPVIAAWYGTDVGVVQQTLVAFFVALAVGQPIYGPLADMFGRRRPLIGGLLLFVAASIGGALAPDIGTLIVLRFLQGFGICAAVVIVRAVVRDLYTGPPAAQLLSLTFLLLGVSPLVAPLAGSFFLEYFSWQSVFWVFAFGGVLGLALIFWTLPETLPPEKRDRASLAHAFSGYGAILRDGRFMALTFVTGLSQTMLFAYVVGSAFFFMGVHGLAPWAYSLLFATSAIAGIGLTQFSAMAMRIVGTERLVVLASALSAAATTLHLVLTLLDAAPLVVAMPLIYLAFAGLAFSGTPGTVLALDPWGSRAGTASALMGTIQFGLSALGAGIISALFDGTAVPLAAMMAGCAVASLLIAWATLGFFPARKT